MAEVTMPAAEAEVALAYADERNSYELAFHVLPTVAEGEVAGVFDELKARITKVGGTIFDEEAPQRIDLAYDIEKHIEGKNRSFHSAYFGWVRFSLESAKLESLTEDIDTRTDILRYLLIKLTKLEEQNPFRFHEAEKAKKMVEIVGEKETPARDLDGVDTEVSEEKLDESLERITEDTDVAGEKADTIEKTEVDK